MGRPIDIYNLKRRHEQYCKKLESALKAAKAGKTTLFNQRSKQTEVYSVQNIKLLLDFNTTTGLEGLSLSRRIRYIEVCLQFVRFINKDLDTLTDDDIKKILLWIEERDNPWTKQVYKVILKKLIKYVDNPTKYLHTQEYPERVRWIKVHVKKKDKPKVERDQLLTEEEVLKCIQVLEDPRDKALFALQTETGCRVGELANLRIKDIIAEKLNPTSEEVEYFVRLNGKTGERTVIIFYSVPYLLDWLNKHPEKNNQNSPLWTLRLKKEVRPLKYGGISKIIKQAYQKAGIAKLARTHYIRHARITLDSKQGVSDAIAKKRFGWIEDTRQLATYSHLIDEDVHNYYRKKQNKDTAKVLEPVLTVKQCHKCHVENAITNDFCSNCKTIINIETATILKENQEQQHKETEARLKILEEALLQIAGKLETPMPISLDGQTGYVSTSGATINGEFKPFKKT